MPGPGGPIEDAPLGRGRGCMPFPFGIGRGGPWADIRGSGEGVVEGDPGWTGAATVVSSFGRLRLTKLRLWRMA